MASTTKKIVITALATGGIVAGVATASAAPLRSASPVAATAAEAEALHGQVVSLTAREQALRASLEAELQARQRETPTTTPTPESVARAVVAVQPTTVPAPPVATTAPAPTTTAPVATEDHSRDTVVGAPTTTEPESEHPTTTSTPSESDAAASSSGAGSTHGDEGGAHD